MSRAPTSIRKRDLVTALQAAASAGLKVVRIEVGKDGRIVLTTVEPSATTACPESNEWDQILRHDKD